MVNKVDPRKPIPSPCVSICALDDDDICTGCYRSGMEIIRWGRMTEDEKRQVYANLEQRKSKAGIVFK